MASRVDLIASEPASIRPRAVRFERVPAIRLRALTKLFPVRRGWRGALPLTGRRERFPALDHVTLDVAEGELFGILGRNGAGKTTLFRILSTLVLSDGGSAEVVGLSVSRQAQAVRNSLAVVPPEERSLSWRISARENLRLYAALFRIPRVETERRVSELITLLDLDGEADRMVATLSSGRRQRLLLARALLARPRVLLLDEPTRGLDPLSARSFRAFLRDELAGRDGCTVLLATHDGEEALGFCDRVAVLERGRLLAADTPDVLADRYAEERYRVWTRVPGHPALRALAVDGGMARPADTAAEPGGWIAVDLGLRGGPDAAAEVLARLAREGLPIARFERLRPSLADLIARMVERETSHA